MEHDDQKYGLFFDKRVSVGNIITTISMVVMIVVWSARLETRVDMVRSTTTFNGIRIDKLEGRLDSQNIEIIRRLERMEDKIDARFTQSNVKTDSHQ